MSPGEVRTRGDGAPLFWCRTRSRRPGRYVLPEVESVATGDVPGIDRIFGPRSSDFPERNEVTPSQYAILGVCGAVCTCAAHVVLTPFELAKNAGPAKVELQLDFNSSLCAITEVSRHTSIHPVVRPLKRDGDTGAPRGARSWWGRPSRINSLRGDAPLKLSR